MLSQTLLQMTMTISWLKEGVKMEMILNAILTVAFSTMAITGSVSFISFLIEDKKRSKYEEERNKRDAERWEQEMKKYQ